MRLLRHDAKLLEVVGGKPLIVQIESARAGYDRDLVDQRRAPLGDALSTALGDGQRSACRIAWSRGLSRSRSPAASPPRCPCFPEGAHATSPATSHELRLRDPAARGDTMALDDAGPRVHLVMVPNLPYHPVGEIRAEGGPLGRVVAAHRSAASRRLRHGAVPRTSARHRSSNLSAAARLDPPRLVSASFDGPGANVGTPDESAAPRQMPATRTTLERARAAHEAPPPDSATDMPTPARLLRTAPLRRDPPGARHARGRPLPGGAPDERHRRPTRPRPRGTNVVEPDEPTCSTASIARGAVRHLNAVVNTPALRDAYNENLPKVIEFFTDLVAGPGGYEGYRALREGAGVCDARRRAAEAVDNEIRDFSWRRRARRRRARNGQGRPRGAGRITTRFEENLLDATNEWAYYAMSGARKLGAAFPRRDPGGP